MLWIRALEIESDSDIKHHKLEVELQALCSQPSPSPHSRQPSADHSGSVHTVFDISKYVKLVPLFREAEVDSYFTTFEQVAEKFNWPKDMWVLLLQCNLVGKAQEVCSALPVEEALDYDVLKPAILRAYELVPEAYRQRFREHSKAAKQTFVEFAREEKGIFHKWCAASRTETVDHLRELLLLEDFKTCIAENIVMHINEQKVSTLAVFPSVSIQNCAVGSERVS